MATILVVEDERPIAQVIADNLRFDGFDVLIAHDGETGLQTAQSETVDLILLDIMMPGMDGYEVCRRLREGGRRTPVIMLSARGEEVDKVLGLELGADDYITKPVGVRELLARVKAVLWRAPEGWADDDTEGGQVLTFGEARIDFGRYEASLAGEAVHLSPKAFGVLKLLWEQHGKAVSRSEILHEVWGYDVLPTTRTVDNHVAELRAALEADSSAPRHLLTVHGVGYRLADVTPPQE